MSKISYLFMALVVTAFFSCAREKEESTREIQEKILDAYIQTHCPNATRLSSGLTIIDFAEGAGIKPGDYDGIYIHYSTYNLAGTCQSTTDSVQARMLGTYDPAIYYGPSIFVLDGTVTKGMTEILKKMNKGATATAIIPPWLTVSTNSGTGGYSEKGQQSQTSMIYSIKAGIVIDDADKFQIDSIESYIKMNFTPKIDSTAKGYYFRNFVHTEGIPDKDTVVAGKSVNVWYVGRLLDGYVFDTNIADTAKKYKIYDSSSDYEPLSVSITERWEDMASYSTNTGQSNSSADESVKTYVPGFARALKSMTYKDKAVSIFMSGLGYGSQGSMESGKGVPPYAMLRFDLWMARPTDNRFPPTKD